MPIGIPSDRGDVNEAGSAAGTISVGATATEIKVGTSRLAARQLVVIFNDSANTMYTSPSASVTTTSTNKGIPLFKNQERVIAIGDVAHYVIAGSAGNSLIVQEYS